MLLSENIELPGASAFPFHFSINYDVLEELVFSAEYDQRDSVALLLGERNADNIAINGFSSLQIAKLDNAFFTVKASLTERLVAQTQRQINKSEEIVPTHPSSGWFVSMPGGNAKLTDDIMRVHFSLFNLGHLPLLILDPENQKIALYGKEKFRFKNLPLIVNK